jgi:cell division protein FtsZ
MVKVDKDFVGRQAFSQKAKIRVIGVGGGGNNAVDRMIEDNVEGIDFVAVNTDSQVLQRSNAGIRIQLGEKLTGGLGAGGMPEIGAGAAEESKDEILTAISGSDMLFVTAGMGGGTGTGAAPVIAQLAKSLGILTVGVVTKPFVFEGKVRMENALKGIEELSKSVDTLLIIPNEKLLEIMDEAASFKDALKKADEVLTQGVQGISSLISNPGLINLDFADVRTIMKDKGIAHIGIGRATGKNRAIQAAENAINSPLLETSIKGAHAVLVNITGSGSLGIHEVNEASNFITSSTETEEASIIFGSSINEELKDEIIVTVVATAFGPAGAKKPLPQGIASSQAAGLLTGTKNQEGDAQKQDDNDQQIILPIFLQKNRR